VNRPPTSRLGPRSVPDAPNEDRTEFKVKTVIENGNRGAASVGAPLHDDVTSAPATSSLPGSEAARRRVPLGRGVISPAEIVVAPTSTSMITARSLLVSAPDPGRVHHYTS
jgi:hypothetical protein